MLYRKRSEHSSTGGQTWYCWGQALAFCIKFSCKQLVTSHLLLPCSSSRLFVWLYQLVTMLITDLASSRLPLSAGARKRHANLAVRAVSILKQNLTSQRSDSTRSYPMQAWQEPVPHRNGIPWILPINSRRYSCTGSHILNYHAHHYELRLLCDLSNIWERKRWCTLVIDTLQAEDKVPNKLQSVWSFQHFQLQRTWLALYLWN